MTTLSYDLDEDCWLTSTGEEQTHGQVGDCGLAIRLHSWIPTASAETAIETVWQIAGAESSLSQDASRVLGTQEDGFAEHLDP